MSIKNPDRTFNPERSCIEQEYRAFDDETYKALTGRDKPKPGEDLCSNYPEGFRVPLGGDDVVLVNPQNVGADTIVEACTKHGRRHADEVFRGPKPSTRATTSNPMLWGQGASLNNVPGYRAITTGGYGPDEGADQAQTRLQDAAVARTSISRKVTQKNTEQARREEVNPVELIRRQLEAQGEGE